MPLSELQYRRTHNLLLISKLFNARDHVSPFTLVIDSLEQSSRPLIREWVYRAKVLKKQVILVSYETLKAFDGVDVVVYATRDTHEATQRKVISHATQSGKETLVVIDSLFRLISCAKVDLSSFLSSIISPTTSLLAVYHSDVPRYSNGLSSYSPHPLMLLKYLSTTLFTVHSLSQILARTSASQRSLEAPSFGIDERIEGVIAGRGGNDRRGIVIEMEHRRKSGRSVREWYFLPNDHGQKSVSSGRVGKESIILLEDHPSYKDLLYTPAGEEEAERPLSSTFNLSLTEQQRRDREGVVLPYFDAQSKQGTGEGGRILYDMGLEDDFDEEEDEI